MYYYAYINESKIATRVYEMPVEMSAEQGFIEISKEVFTASTAGTEGSVIGMHWNAEKGIWEEVAKYYYAVLIEKTFRKEVTEEEEVRYFVKKVIESGEKVENSLYIEIDGLDGAEVGQLYDPDTAGFTTPEFNKVAFTDTDQVSVNGTNVALTDKLAETDEAVKALEDKVSEVKEQVENIDIPEVTATTILEKLKTVDGASSGIDADLLDGKDSTYFATVQGLQDLTTVVNGKAATNHSHSNYASSVTTTGSGNAITAISQSGNAITATKGASYALSNHTHSNYASSVTTTGSGNAITAISQSGNAITATKGASYALSNHTHTGSCVTAYMDWNEEEISSSDEAETIANACLEDQVGGWTESDGYLVVPKTGNYLMCLSGSLRKNSGSLSGSNLLGVELGVINSDSKQYIHTSDVISASQFQLLSSSLSKKVIPSVYAVVNLTAGQKLKFRARAYSAYNNNAITCSIKTIGNLMMMEI